MKKTRILAFISLLLVMVLSITSIAPAALAANETSTASTGAALELETAETIEEDPVVKFKAGVIRLVNLEREKAGIEALTELDSLHPVADVRAQESSVSFSHTRPNNTRCFTIFGENDLKYKAAGENLAFGFRTPEAVVKAWMGSTGHRRNIMDPDFTFIGIGYYTNENGRVYCSQLFYTPKAQ